MNSQSTAGKRPTVVLATRNRGKLREFQELLRPQGWEVLGLSDLAIGRDVDETGRSFGENARLKALGYSHVTSLPVLADDSGLEVFALGGRPGIESARYAGSGASDSDRVRKLLAELRATGGPREARFVCALAMAQSDVLVVEAEGECRGIITEEPRGVGGFGYDPIFLVPELGRTFAELDEDVKNRVSHRFRAVAALMAKLR